MAKAILVRKRSCPAIEPAMLKQVLPPGNMEKRHVYRSPGG
jgi:hypothetical protein